MIEAVNVALSTASYTKAVVEQQSVVRSYAANPSRVQETPQAPFVSLYVKVDIDFDKAVLQMRDGDTGDVVRQIPTESQLEAYRRAQTATPAERQKAELSEQRTAEISLSSSSDSGSHVPVQTAQPSVPSSPSAPVSSSAPVAAETPTPSTSGSVDTTA